MSRELLPLDQYDLFIVSYSGGKDSLACLLHLLECGVPPERIELWHQHVDGEPGGAGLMDWPCTEGYVRATGEAFGLRVRFQWKVGGFEGEMLREEALTRPTRFELRDGSVGQAGGRRGKLSTRRLFPQTSADLSVRWCSSYLKIDVASVALNNDPDLQTGTICFVTGERRQESAARARYAEVEPHRCDRATRRVDQWRPVIDWDEDAVWAIIRRHGVVPHPAYYLGWGRVSCLACIFGDADQWASVRALAPARFDAIASYEMEFGKTIKRSLTVLDQADRGTPFEMDPETARLAMSREYPVSRLLVEEGKEWRMPAGAFRRCDGPT